MDKIWFIQINGKEEGPYTIQELKNDSRITPDTLVRKIQSDDWKPARYVLELQEIFKDEKPNETQEEESKKAGIEGAALNDLVVLSLKENTPNFLFWIVITLLVLSYILYQINWMQ